MNFHPYLNGYSVLPNLTKFNGEFFVQDADLVREKHLAVQRQDVFFEHDITPEIYECVCEFIAKEANLPLASFPELIMQLGEDVAIHRMRGEEDWLAACHICFPSGWWPAEKIGRPLRDIHAPIPGMNLAASNKLVKAMVHSGPFDRFVWSIAFEPKVNFHPSLPKAGFDPSLPIYLKIERQITVGFPKFEAALFILRQALVGPGEINYERLHAACEGMTPSQRAYKGVSQELLNYLSEKRALQQNTSGL